MSDTLHGRYYGKGGPLFTLYLKTALLTVLTLGIYRFWGKTRIRRYIWSATYGDEDAFEYTGTGLEKFLGFLIAIVVLAIYLGIVQMLLFFFGITLFSEPTTQAEILAQLAGIYITIFAAVPLFLFAQYRARRYRMARTRWRGLRFGMEKGAWGYVLRAIGHYLLTAITLGIMLPRQTFYLEKYMADRTWYGDAKFTQEGRWTALYKNMKHLAIGVALLVLSGFVTIGAQSPGLGITLGIVAYIWLFIGMISYRVQAMNYLTRNKTLDGVVTFGAQLETPRILTIYVLGTLAIIGVSVVAGFVFSFAILGIMMGQSGGFDPEAMAAGFPIMGTIASILLYVVFFLLVGGMSLVLIIQKIIEHTVCNISADNAEHLTTIRQRAADKGADAEGFADALDVGAAI